MPCTPAGGHHPYPHFPARVDGFQLSESRKAPGHVSGPSSAPLTCIRSLPPITSATRFLSSEISSFVGRLRLDSILAQLRLLTDLCMMPLLSTVILPVDPVDFHSGMPVVVPENKLLPRLPNLCRLWLCDLSELALLWNRTSPRAGERCTLHEVGWI